jgi:transcriptional regulator with XRE-family HTH domain
MKERREQLGLSQAAVAEAVNVNTSYIGLLERGERVPSIEVLVELAAALDVDLASVFADEESAKSPEMVEVTRIRALLTGWPAKHRKAAVKVVEEMGKLLG